MTPVIVILIPRANRPNRLLRMLSEAPLCHRRTVAFRANPQIETREPDFQPTSPLTTSNSGYVLA